MASNQVTIFQDQVLSKNEHCTVFKATCGNIKCVAKVFPGLNIRDSDWQQIKQAVEKLKTHDNPCLAKYFIVHANPNVGRAILREFVSYNLTEYLASISGHLPFITQVDLSCDISSSLSYLHSKGIIHGKLTSSNILITTAGQAKICDYGMVLHPLCALSKMYITRHTPSEKDDVLSFGILVIHILKGRQPHPIQGEDREENRWSREIAEIDSLHPLRTKIITNCIKGNCPSIELVHKEIESIKQSQMYWELRQLAHDKKQLTDTLESQNKTIERYRQLPEFLPHTKWVQKDSASVQMRRSADAVTDGSKVYIRLSQGKQVLVYNLVDQKWDERCLECKYYRSSLVIVNNDLIAVGGTKNLADGTPCSDELIKIVPIIAEDNKHFGKMAEKRSRCTAIVTDQRDMLIIAGGENPVGTTLTSVEVLNLTTNTWSIVSSLPEKRYSCSAAIVNNHLYLLGGWIGCQEATRAVLKCSIEELRISQNTDTDVWDELASELPVAQATCISYKNQLFTFGGTWCHCYNCRCSKPTSNIYRYDEDREEFECVGSTPAAQYLCFACTIPVNKIFIAGGAENDSEALKDAYMYTN